MDRSEPAFIPQWLKSTGSVTAGGTNQAGSFLRSDEQSVLKHSRNKSSVSSSEHDMTRSFVHERTSSAYFHRSSSSKDSANSRSYSSVNRSYRDKQWDDLHEFQDKEKSFMDELKHPEGSVLRHSQSMISRKSNGSFARKVVGDPINTTSNNHISSNGHLLPGSTVPSSSQNNFARDFPSLITEQGQGSELRRIPSPIQASSSVSQDGWTSSLAEVPVLGGSGSATTGSLSSQQMTTASSVPRVNGVKMAEAVAQSPSRARTPPQISVETQRLQELAIKQSRQLIPMTPSMPKPLSPSPLEKSKAKSGIQQSQFFPHSMLIKLHGGGPVRVDLGKTSGLGKLQVLKSSRELNGVSLNVKDSPSPKNGVSSPLSQTPSAASLHGSNRNPFSNQNPAGLERKVQSRNDFFNLIKKKSSVSSPSVLETSNDDSIEEAVATASLDSSGSDTMGDDGAKITTNGECNKEALVNHMEQEQANFYISPLDEKEAAFMHSLGWESSGEDESITEDEINSFLEYAKTRPISELQGFWFLRLQNGRGN